MITSSTNTDIQQRTFLLFCFYFIE